MNVLFGIPILALIGYFFLAAFADNRKLPKYIEILIISMFVYGGMIAVNSSSYRFERESLKEIDHDNYLILGRVLDPLAEINPGSLYEVPLSGLNLLIHNPDHSLTYRVLNRPQESKMDANVVSMDCKTKTIMATTEYITKPFPIHVNNLENAICERTLLHDWTWDSSPRGEIQRVIDNRFYEAVLIKTLKAVGILVLVMVFIYYWSKLDYNVVKEAVKVKFFNRDKLDYHPSDLISVAWLMVKNIENDLPQAYDIFFTRIEETKRILGKLFTKHGFDPNEFIFLYPEEILEEFHKMGYDTKTAAIKGLDKYLLTVLFPVAQYLNQQSRWPEYNEFSNAYFELERGYMQKASFMSIVKYNQALASNELLVQNFDELK